MSHGKCDCGSKFPLAMNKDVHFHIGVWCGNCNQKWSFSTNVDDGQTKLWPRYFKCTCDARRFKQCTCDPEVIEMNCAICQCTLYADDETFECQYGIVDVLCFRSLEILGKVWD